MPEVLILTGPPGAGKSSAAEALAERYDRVAHIPVETLRRFVTPTGFAKPGQPGRERQQLLGVRNACALAANFLAERYAVIIEDVITHRAGIETYLEGLRAAGAPVHAACLLPSLDVCLERSTRRREQRVSPERLEAIYREFEAAQPLPGAIIDTSDLSPEVTADRLQALTTSGESLVWRPD